MEYYNVVNVNGEIVGKVNIETPEKDNHFVEQVCKLVGQVGEHFNYKYASDCFCVGINNRPVIDYQVIDFIREAIDEKIAKEKIAKESENKEPVSVAYSDASFAVVGEYNGGAGVLCWMKTLDDARKAFHWYQKQGGKVTVKRAAVALADPFAFP